MNKFGIISIKIKDLDSLVKDQEDTNWYHIDTYFDFFDDEAFTTSYVAKEPYGIAFITE